MKKIILFDIDGTLLLTGGGGQIAFEKAFYECFGISDSWGNTKPDGKTDPVIFREIALRELGRQMNDEEYELLCKKYLDYFPQALEEAPRFRLMPGIPQLIQTLFEKGYVLGMATGNFEASAWAKVKKAKLDEYFLFGGFASDSDQRKYIVQKAMQRAGEHIQNHSVDKKCFFVVGDTPHDIQSGKDNGIQTIAVATGSYSAQDLEQCNPNFVFTDFSNPTPFLNIL